MARIISFRAKDSREAATRLEEALNREPRDASEKIDQAKGQEIGEALSALLSAFPQGRAVVVSMELRNGAEPDAEEQGEKIRVRVSTTNDASGQLAEGAERGDMSLDVSTGDSQHAREVAAAEQAERDRLAREAQSRADDLRNTSSTPGVQAGDTVGV